jgi:hypothetical protein
MCECTDSFAQTSYRPGKNESVVLERRGKKLTLASLTAVLWTKRCSHANERSGNVVITFRLVGGLQRVQFFADVECNKLGQSIRQLRAYLLKQITSFSQFSYRVFRKLRLFAPLTLSLSIERNWRTK